LTNIASISGTFSNSTNYAVNLSGNVGPTGNTGHTGPVPSNFKVTINITYNNTSGVNPHVVSVSPNSFYNSIVINGDCIVIGGVVRGVPDYVSVSSLQPGNYFNNLASSEYVSTKIYPAASIFRVGYDPEPEGGPELYIKSASLTTLLTNVLAPVPQATITLFYLF
jgi:hypothetical protein